MKFANMQNSDFQPGKGRGEQFVSLENQCFLIFLCVELLIGLPFHSFLRKFDLPFNSWVLNERKQSRSQCQAELQSCPEFKSGVGFVTDSSVTSLHSGSELTKRNLISKGLSDSGKSAKYFVGNQVCFLREETAGIKKCLPSENESQWVLLSL